MSTAYEFDSFTISTVFKRKPIRVSFYQSLVSPDNAPKPETSIYGLELEDICELLGLEITLGNVNPPLHAQKAAAEAVKEEIKEELAEAKAEEPPKKKRKRRTKAEMAAARAAEAAAAAEAKPVAAEDDDCIEPEVLEPGEAENEKFIAHCNSISKFSELVTYLRETEGVQDCEGMVDRVKEVQAHVPKLASMKDLPDRIEKHFNRLYGE